MLSHQSLQQVYEVGLLTHFAENKTKSLSLSGSESSRAGNGTQSYASLPCKLSSRAKDPSKGSSGPLLTNLSLFPDRTSELSIPENSEASPYFMFPGKMGSVQTPTIDRGASKKRAASATLSLAFLGPRFPIRVALGSKGLLGFEESTQL